MTAAEIRQQFLDFFKSKGHTIVPSAPIVVKNDPTLLFTNAGMNQFKDAFLGNQPPVAPRIADTQKCLRVSGKHNDLEEVGVDTYHHTMFEMLGNWSFGDYFKKDAIAWSWELLTKVYGLPEDRLYVTVFQGDEKEDLPRDEEAYGFWKEHTTEDRILLGNKKDNFWEMGDTGPCGPCTEIHVDMRSDAERAEVSGAQLVNADHPQVIEIWNNVFMQFNRLKDGTLQPLPAQHVDTGMGLERLVRALQGKTSNYDTDLFTGTIAEVARITGKTYDGSDNKEAVAFRVIADHIRAIAFTIADGQLPSNTGAGYVIRRILRRAVRYYYSYLDYKVPLLHQLMPGLASQFESVFPELTKQLDFVSRVVREEEEAFLRTIDKGLRTISDHVSYVREINNFLDAAYQKDFGFTSRSETADTGANLVNATANAIAAHIADEIAQPKTGFNRFQLRKRIETIADYERAFSTLKTYVNTLPGELVFKLSDEGGFPPDLTALIAKDEGLSIDEEGFKHRLAEQKTRSRAATALDTGDWVVLEEGGSTEFVGYDSLETKARVLRYRKVKAKGKESYQIVLDRTPFYAESGGQVGDRGQLAVGSLELAIEDTKKENDLIIHFASSIPDDLSGEVIARVDAARRRPTEAHHSATHLLHAALRKVLGAHVAQKGSLVNAERLRFDFSHFSKMSDEELREVEKLVNEKIRENVPVSIRTIPKEEAMQAGAMALFGEKYGDQVRVVTMDAGYSVELCGGTHVGHTGALGFFKIVSEGAVAAGVRRVEAVSGAAAEEYVQSGLQELAAARTLLKNPKDFPASIEALQEETAALRKSLEAVESKALAGQAKDLAAASENVAGIAFVGAIVEAGSGDAVRKLATECLRALDAAEAAAVVICAVVGGKSSVAIALSGPLVETKGLDAAKLIKEQVAPLIKGGGGGQKGLATAGGVETSHLQEVIQHVRAAL